MRTVLRRALGLTTAGLLAATGVGVIAAPASAQTATPCQLSCIVVDDISGTPEGAVFTFHTTALTRVRAQITNLDGTKPVVLTPPTTWDNNYQLTADDSARFHQATVYKYAIVATDTAGATREYRGEFVTLYRTASVHFDNLHVIKDGDDLGPGDFVEAGRCGSDADWFDLTPLVGDGFYAWLEDKYVELNDGQSTSLTTDYDCPGPVGPTVEPQTSVADDDAPGPVVSSYFWSPGDPHANARWNQDNWDESYTAQTVTDPLDPTATGTADVPILTTSPFRDPDGFVANMRYQVSGHVTFTQAAPMVNLVLERHGALMFNLDPSAGAAGGSIALRWTPGLYPEVGDAVATRVQWKARTSATWKHADVLSTAAYYRIDGLPGGQMYDIAVSLVMPDDTLAMYTPIGFYLPNFTGISGWSTTTVTAPVGTKVPVTR